MNEKFFGMIGLARRASKTSTGEAACTNAVRSGAAKLVIIAEDASENTKKSLVNSCEYYKVKYTEAGSAAELGRCTGSPRLAAVSINDNNFAKAILNKLDKAE